MCVNVDKESCSMTSPMTTTMTSRSPAVCLIDLGLRRSTLPATIPVTAARRITTNLPRNFCGFSDPTREAPVVSRRRGVAAHNSLHGAGSWGSSRTTTRLRRSPSATIRTSSVATRRSTSRNTTPRWSGVDVWILRGHPCRTRRVDTRSSRSRRRIRRTIGVISVLPRRRWSTRRSATSWLWSTATSATYTKNLCVRQQSTMTSASRKIHRLRPDSSSVQQTRTSPLPMKPTAAHRTLVPLSRRTTKGSRRRYRRTSTRSAYWTYSPPLQDWSPTIQCGTRKNAARPRRRFVPPNTWSS